MSDACSAVVTAAASWDASCAVAVGPLCTCAGKVGDCETEKFGGMGDKDDRSEGSLIRIW